MATGDGGSAGFTMRTMTLEDVHEAGQVYFTAFSVDSAATGIPPTFNVASPDAGRKLFQFILSRPSYFCLAAFDGAGKLVGGACIDAGEGRNSLPDWRSRICAISFACTILSQVIFRLLVCNNPERLYGRDPDSM